MRNRHTLQSATLPNGPGPRSLRSFVQTKEATAINAKKAKRIRQRLRASGYDPNHDEKLEQASGRIVTAPESGRSIYQRIKQLGIE